MIAAGFALLALWQLTELVARHETSDKAKAGSKLVLSSALAWTSFTLVLAAKVGYIGKGIALAAVGILFITAAIQQRAGNATGLDRGLRSMRDLPAGTVILLGIALGLAAYGVYSFARARYARV